MKKQTKGITLIALVITIIILLILATVTINFTIGENGILKRTKEAKNKYINAEAEETKYENDINKFFDDNGLNKKISAELVSFTPNDSNWDVTNVKEALDYLYNI